MWDADGAPVHHYFDVHYNGGLNNPSGKQIEGSGNFVSRGRDRSFEFVARGNPDGGWKFSATIPGFGNSVVTSIEGSRDLFDNPNPLEIARYYLEACINSMTSPDPNRYDFLDHK